MGPQGRRRAELRGSVEKVACDLCDAFVLKPDGDASRFQIDCDAVPHDHGPGVVDLKLVAARQLHGERLESIPFVESGEPLLELFCGHRSIV